MYRGLNEKFNESVGEILMSLEKQFLNEIALKLGKVYTDKNNPPFKVNEQDYWDEYKDDDLGVIDDEDYDGEASVPPNVTKADIDASNKAYNAKSSGVGLKLPTSNAFQAKQDELDYKYGGGQYKRDGNTFQDREWNKYVDKQMQDPDNKMFKSVSQQNLDKKLALSKKLSSIPGETPPVQTAGIPWGKVALGVGGTYAALKLLKKYRDKKKRQNDHYQPSGVQLNEGPSYEYKKHIKNIQKTNKQHSGAILDLYELLRKKGLDKEASMLLEAYKKNLVTFKKTYDIIMRKLV